MSSKVTGTVGYRLRMALPPDAVVKVRLEDVSRADAPAEIVAESPISTGGRQVPIPFQLDYDPAQIQPNHRYHLRAQIFVGDSLRFTSTSAYPVLTNGTGKTAEIQVDPVRTSPAKPDAMLEGRTGS